MKKNILKKITSDKDIKTLSEEELEQQLDAELNKKNIDFDVVDELTKYILENKYNKIPEISNQEINESIQEIKETAKSKSDNKRKIIIRTAACAAALLIGLNVYTVSAYNENIFSFAVQYTKGGVLVNFNKEPKETEISIPVSSDDPYGIIAKCEEVGLENIIAPTYLPDGFVLSEINQDNDDCSNYIHFVFRNGKQLISIIFDEYHNENQIPENIGIPSDEYNISEIEICGNTAVMSREDNQMNVLCLYGKKEISIFTQNVPYDECDKIIDSCKK